MSFFSNINPSDRLERRYEARHKSYLTAILHQNNHETFATIVNLSKTGLGILSGKRFNEGDTFEVSLTQKKNNRIMVKINVQACREVDGEYLVGTKIIKANEGHSRFYDEIVHAHRPTISY